jgi:futalosine hydrolase
VVTVSEETLADMGVEEDGKWKDIFDLKLEKSSYHPFERRKLPNPWLSKYNLLKLPEVSGITINEISTDKERINQFIKKYNPFIESMEGARCIMFAVKQIFLLYRYAPFQIISAKEIKPTGK